MIRKILFIITSFLILSFAGNAQSLEFVLDKHYSAKNMEKLDKVKAIKYTGTALQMGMETPFTNIVMRPDKFYLEVPIQGEYMKQAYNGEIGWMIAPWSGSLEPFELTGEQLRGLKMQADMDGMLYNYEEKGYETELSGIQKLNGSKVFVITQSNKEGDIYKHYIDTENYLLLKSVTIMEMQGMDVEFTSHYTNYKPVKGIPIAHTIEVDMGEQGKRSVTITGVDINPEIDPDIFEMP